MKPHITHYNLILFKIKITKENKEIETLTLAQRKKKPGVNARPNTPLLILPLAR